MPNTSWFTINDLRLDASFVGMITLKTECPRCPVALLNVKECDATEV
jgi:hypothetical protein